MHNVRANLQTLGTHPSLGCSCQIFFVISIIHQGWLSADEWWVLQRTASANAPEGSVALHAHEVLSTIPPELHKPPLTCQLETPGRNDMCEGVWNFSADNRGVRRVGQRGASASSVAIALAEQSARNCVVTH
eukprot:360484-Chlamydomonas_euryale.AAC.7